MRCWIALCLVLLLSPGAAVAAARTTAKLDVDGVYSVEVRDDGLVSYEGRKHVLILGHRERRISPGEAKALFDAFRDSGFEKLKDKYPTTVAHYTAIALTFTDGGRTKTVIDEVGNPALLPDKLVDLQKALGRYAERWVSGDAETVAELQRDGWDFRSRESADLLARAARLSPENVTLKLIELGAPIDGSENRGLEGRVSTIRAAALKRRRQVVRALIEKGAFQEPPPLFDQEGVKEVVLRAAARAGDPILVAEILAHGADVRARGLGGTSALEEAVRSGDAETVRVLLAAGADAGVVGWLGGGLLQRADNAETVRLLLAAGLDPNGGFDGRNALHYVDNVEKARVLIDAGTEVNKRDSNGVTPLLTARSEGIALAMIDAGADVTASHRDGTTLASIAGVRGWKRVLERLFGSAPGWGKLVTNPDWIESPTRGDISRHMPRRAREDRVGGRATLSCLIVSTGRLDGCAIVSQQPTDYGFGDAALEVARYYRMPTLTQTGLSVEGATVRVAIAFSPAS